MVRVAVIGAGVNGMGSAVKIKEKYPQYDVRDLFIMVFVLLRKDFQYFKDMYLIPAVASSY